jgi:hypothetical protein
MPKHKQEKVWYCSANGIIAFKKHVYVDHCMIAKKFEEELNIVWS